MDQAVEVAVYIPYRRTGGTWEFFLQKRDGNAQTHPNIFSMFGGHMEEGEDSLTAVLREVNEELVYVPKELTKFPRTFVSDANGKLFDVYIERVGPDFEHNVTVLEGEYGAFLTGEEIGARSDVSKVCKDIVTALLESLVD